MEIDQQVIPVLVTKLREVFGPQIDDEGLLYDIADVMVATIQKHGYKLVRVPNTTEDGSAFFDMEEPK